MIKSEEIAGHIIALLTVSLWGVTFVSTRILLQSFTPEEILIERFSLGYLALRLLPSQPIPLVSIKREALFAFAGLTGVTLYFLFENIALLYTYVSNVSVIVASAPFFIAVLAWLCLGAQRPGASFSAGFALAMCGIVLVTYKGASVKFNFLGDSLAFVAALSWAFYSIIIRKLSAYGYDSLSITRRVFFYGLVFMLPLVFMDNFHIALEEVIAPVNLANLLFLGLGASAMCFATWTFALKSLGAAKASAYIYLVPVIAIITSSLILNEKIGALTILGAALAILGLIISERVSTKNRDFRPAK